MEHTPLSQILLSVVAPTDGICEKLLCSIGKFLGNHNMKIRPCGVDFNGGFVVFSSSFHLMVLTCYVLRQTLPVVKECVNKFMNTVKFYVYILECSDKTLYTGYTNNIEKRLHEHNSTGHGARYTSGRRPVKLVYSESYSTQSDAIRREVKIKRLSRSKKLMLIKDGYASDK